MSRQGWIFDLDGTLVDSLPGIRAALNRALAAAGLPEHPLAAVRGFVGDGARALVTRAAPVGTAPGMLADLEGAFKADYETSWPQGTTAYAGIYDVLDECVRQGLAMAVLSNKPHAFTTVMVEQVFPGIPFAVVLGQRAGVAHKPDPAGALEIAAALGLDPAACTVVGDSTMDLATARRAGMRSLAVTWGYHERAALIAAEPDGVVETPTALAARIREKSDGRARGGAQSSAPESLP